MNYLKKNNDIKKSCALRFANLVKPFDHLSWVHCPFRLRKAHTPTPCCFGRPLTPSAQPDGVRAGRSLEVTLRAPKGQWRPLDLGAFGFCAAAPGSSTASGNLERDVWWLRRGTHIYPARTYTQRENAFTRRMRPKLGVRARGGARARFRSTADGKPKANFLFLALQYFTQEHEKWAAL